MLKIWWIWQIEIWSDKLVDGYQTVHFQPGALFWGVQLSGSVSKQIPLMLLQIPLLFRYTPALTAEYRAT